MAVPAPILKVLFAKSDDQLVASTENPRSTFSQSYLCYVRIPRAPHSLLPRSLTKEGKQGPVFLHTINTQMLHASQQESRHQDLPDDTALLQRVYNEQNLLPPRDWKLTERTLTFGSSAEGNNLFAVWADRTGGYVLEVLPDTNSWISRESKTTNFQQRHFAFAVQGGVKGKTYTLHVPNFDTNNLQIHPVYATRKDPTKGFSKWKRCPGRIEWTKFEQVSCMSQPSLDWSTKNSQLDTETPGC